MNQKYTEEVKSVIYTSLDDLIRDFPWIEMPFKGIDMNVVRAQVYVDQILLEPRIMVWTDRYLSGLRERLDWMRRGNIKGLYIGEEHGDSIQKGTFRWVINPPENAVYGWEEEYYREERERESK